MDFEDAAPSPAPADRSERTGESRKQGLTMPESWQQEEPRTVTRAGASGAVPFPKKAGAVGLSVVERPQGPRHGATDEARAPALPSEQHGLMVVVEA